jgi:hypothetical protein
MSVAALFGKEGGRADWSRPVRRRSKSGGGRRHPPFTIDQEAGYGGTDIGPRPCAVPIGLQTAYGLKLLRFNPVDMPKPDIPIGSHRRGRV